MTGSNATPKKVATPKTKKSPAATKKTYSHPPYKSMIKKAVSALNEKGGSSRAAIVKYVSSNYKVGDKVAVQVKMALKRMILNKELVHASSKTHGASGSFKLPAKEPKAKKVAVKKPAKKSPVKKSAAKPKTTKSPKKGKPASPKKPKATKKPAAKKPAAKKAVAKK